MPASGLWAPASIADAGHRWHLDEMVVRIAGERMYLWRAVDHEGGILDMLVQRRRGTRAALRLMRKLLKEARLCAEIAGDRQAALLRQRRLRRWPMRIWC